MKPNDDLLNNWLKVNSKYIVSARDLSGIEISNIDLPGSYSLQKEFFTGPLKDIMYSWIERRTDTSITPSLSGEFISSGTQLIRLKNAIVNCNLNDIGINHEGRLILLDSSHHDFKCYSWILARNNIDYVGQYLSNMYQQSQSNKIVSRQPAFIINTRWSAHNFYHWFHEAMPRLVRLALSGFDFNQYYLVWAGNIPPHSYHIKSLSSLGISLGELHHHSGFCMFSNLLHATFVHRGSFHPKQVSLMKNWFQKYLPEDRSDAKLKVVLVRPKNKARSFIDNDSIKVLVEEHGFQAYEFDNLRLSHQINLVQSSSVIIGAHGAGLTHVINMKPGSRLIEVMPSNSIHPLYWYLASQCKVKYSMLVCKVNNHKQQMALQLNSVLDHLYY
ncbi:MAG: hypothetical protein CBC25_00415 [Pelagibacteraceae bacterium TMED65]|jgi:hypothetical protein|nr:MAG: hypothetical protein CBC25_00415 [Pelagibacteraceae bacterium TMED65]|tara:strand:- start:4272 stop:5432 length:1161 start_codon:yes stop_codon:yes gene_type:complete